jgi:hypothetical protein
MHQLYPKTGQKQLFSISAAMIKMTVPASPPLNSGSDFYARRA